jgi:hypothetical protein
MKYMSILVPSATVRIRTTSRCRMWDGTVSSVRPAAARSSPARRSAARHRLLRPQPQQTMRFRFATRAGGHRPTGSGHSLVLGIVYRRQVFRARLREREDSAGAVEPHYLEAPPTSLMLMTACSSHLSHHQAGPTRMALPCSFGHPGRPESGNIDPAARRRSRTRCGRVGDREPRRATSTCYALVVSR